MTDFILKVLLIGGLVSSFSCKKQESADKLIKNDYEDYYTKYPPSSNEIQEDRATIYVDLPATDCAEKEKNWKK